MGFCSSSFRATANPCRKLLWSFVAVASGLQQTVVGSYYGVCGSSFRAPANRCRKLLWSFVAVASGLQQTFVGSYYGVLWQ